MLCCRLCVNLRTFRTSAVYQAYKSVYNLENLYPNSALNFGGISQEYSDSTSEKFMGIVPIEKVTVKYSRASGPGGQHVNKASTKAEVRFHVESADWIPNDLKPKILQTYSKRISSNGELIVTSDKSRYQMQNVKLCLDKIRSIIEEVGKPPDPRRQERIEQLYDMDKIHAAQKKRLQKKRMQGYTKSMRGGGNIE